MPLQRQFAQPLVKTLPTIIGAFKSAVTHQINTYRTEQQLSPVVVWQRSFYDRVIRDEKELIDTRRYIIENPLHWERDEHYVGREL